MPVLYNAYEPKGYLEMDCPLHVEKDEENMTIKVLSNPHWKLFGFNVVASYPLSVLAWFA
jgi:hypothetical protein